MWDRPCYAQRVPWRWGFGQCHQPQLQRNEGVAATVFSLSGIFTLRPRLCHHPCQVSLLFMLYICMYHVFSERSREALSTRPAAGLDSGHVGCSWRFALGFGGDEGG